MPTPIARTRTELESRWLKLTRSELPSVAFQNRWPIRADHCFQRVLLDAACGGRWYDHMAGRPAYRCADDSTLNKAVELGEGVRDGHLDLGALNAQSLAWRAAATPLAPARRKR